MELRVGGEPVRVWLPAGRYFLNLSGDVEMATTAALRLQRVDGPCGPSGRSPSADPNRRR